VGQDGERIDTEVDCGVVVVTYDSADHLGELLASLGPAAGALSWQVVVVDNGSSDESVRIAREAGATVVESQVNLGYAGGINEGRRHLPPCRFVLVLNPDLTLRPGAIAALAAAATEPGVGATVPRLVDADGATRRSLRYDPTIARAIGDALLGDAVRPRPAWSTEQVDDAEDYERRHPVEWATGAAILLSAEADQVVGDWDESYFMYSEEVDHAQRLRAAGYRIDYVPEAVAQHAEGGSGRNGRLIALLALNRVRCYRSSHGRLRSACFRLVVAAHELSRVWRPERRHSAAVVLGLRPPPAFPAAAPIAGVRW
jgi:GT2 family glycosyltransferase